VNIDGMLASARAGLVRLSPAEADAERRAGAMVVDIRPAANRVAEGEIPGAVVVERIVLEWRLDPGSEWRLPGVEADTMVIVVCNEGYSSSLAASDLRRLGVRRATDLIGGYRAWQAAGLPTVPGGTPAIP
jgi:rhodanese-related sulfurtransferase